MKNRKIELTLEQVVKTFTVPKESMHLPFMLLLIYEKDVDSLKEVGSSVVGPEEVEGKLIEYLEICETDGLIKRTGENIEDYVVRQSLKDIFKDKEQIEEEVEDWIEEWRKIFPAGKNAGGYRMRGDKQGCLKKMEKFIKDNPEVTKEQIFQATKNYVKRFQYPYNYMKLADYFIKKNDTSLLASEIEGLEEKQESYKSSLNQMG